MSRWKSVSCVVDPRHWPRGPGLRAALAARIQPGFGPATSYSPPAVSPYLNLLNRGNPAVNYYGIVRQQIQQGQQLPGTAW